MGGVPGPPGGGGQRPPDEHGPEHLLDTDNTPVHTPEFETNWELSTARALNVARVLMDAGRVDPAQITVSGHAMYKPRTPNITPESRLRNRRVEIELTRPTAPAAIDYKGEGQ